MEVVDVNITDLKPSEYNPRQMTEKQAGDLRKSIEEFDMVEPIVVNKHAGRENIIVGGHQRFFICKEMGRKTMPVVYVDLDEAREKELNLRLNRNLGEWNWDLLANFNEELLKQVGFDEELERLFPKENEKPEETFRNECPKCGYKW